MRAISRDSHSPSPVPEVCIVARFSIRPKRLKSLAWSSAAMPMPSSITSTAAVPPFGWMRTVTRVPACEYLIALVTRFLTTIWNRSGSTLAHTGCAGFSNLKS